MKSKYSAIAGVSLSVSSQFDVTGVDYLQRKIIFAITGHADGGQIWVKKHYIFIKNNILRIYCNLNYCKRGAVRAATACDIGRGLRVNQELLRDGSSLMT
jgi:hypothetical protein